MKRVHYISGLTITIFIGLHLFNHLWSVFGADQHIEMMKTLRLFYRNIFIESILLLVVLIQIISGIKLYRNHKSIAISNSKKLHIWSGLYLAFFFIIHVGAVLGGRFYLQLDTNFYFGAAGLNSFPFNLFFIPYYSLAILSFFGHLAAIHSKKMTKKVLGLTPNQQANTIFILGILINIIILYGLTNHFSGVNIPTEYNILIGK